MPQFNTARKIPTPEIIELSPDDLMDDLEENESAESTEKNPKIPNSSERAESDALIRRKKELAKEAQHADERFLRFMPDLHTSKEGFASHISKINTFESLAYTEPASAETLGEDESGRNSVTRRLYKGAEGKEDIVAYGKADTGELTQRWDDSTQKLIDVRFEWNAGKNILERIETPSPFEGDTNIIRAFKVATEQLENRKQKLAEYYNVDPKDIPLQKDRLSVRPLGIEAGGQAEREYGASALNQAIGWDIVPSTVLRTEADGSSLVSIQESAKASNPEKPPRPIEYQELKDMLDKGKDHPWSKSAMRTACLVFLTKDLDGNLMNYLIDPSSGDFTKIDSGLSQPLSEADPAKNDPFESPLLEIVNQNTDWFLDDDGLNDLNNLYDELLQFQQQINNGVPEESAEGGKARIVAHAYNIMFKHPNIAKKELETLLQKLNYLITNKRPILEAGTGGNELAPYFLDRVIRNEYKKAEEETMDTKTVVEGKRGSAKAA